jgi:hypothetical protein
MQQRRAKRAIAIAIAITITKIAWGSGSPRSLAGPGPQRVDALGAGA